MSCATFSQELADLLSITSNFKALTKDELREKVRKALQMCLIEIIVISKQNDVIIKYMVKRLEIVISLIDAAIAPALVSPPTSATAPTSTDAKKSSALIVKKMQPFIVKPLDSDAAVASKEEIMSNANETFKKTNVRNARVTNKGTLFVEVFYEMDREGTVSRLKEGFSNSYVVEAAKMLPPKLTIVGIPLNIPGVQIISAFVKNMNNSIIWLKTKIYFLFIFFKDL